MKYLKTTWIGTEPLIMHSCATVNPLHPISKALKPLTSKKNKTEEDIYMISDLDWEGALYWDDNIGVYLPSQNIRAALVEGAKANKKGKDIIRHCRIMDLRNPVDYGETLTKEELKRNFDYREVRIMTVQRNKVVRTRPRFNEWRVTFLLGYDETKIDKDVIIEAMENAGKYIGVGDSRPDYGRFVVDAEEVAI